MFPLRLARFLGIREEEYRERYLVQVNLVQDFSGGDRFRPYLIGGLGIEHIREEFPGAREPFFSSTGVAGSGGVGTRIRLLAERRASTSCSSSW